MLTQMNVKEFSPRVRAIILDFEGGAGGYLILVKRYAPTCLAIFGVLILIAVFVRNNLTRNDEVKAVDGLSYGSSSYENDGVLKRERSLTTSGMDRSKSKRQHLTVIDREGIRRRLNELPDEEAVALLLSWAERDISVAYELAMEFGGLEGRGEAAREALRGLMGRDVDSAIAWGENRETSPEMDLFWAAAIDLTAGTNPPMAFAYANKTSGVLRITLLEDIFSEWADEDVDTARRAALGLALQEERSLAHLVLLAAGLQNDLENTLAWIESIKDQGLQDVLYYEAARDWAVRDPAGAAGFAESLGEGDYKTHVAGMVLESWIKADANAAMDWASKLTDQESREEAISRGIRQTFDTSPQQAATLSLQIPAESDRAAALEYIISAWIEIDPDALAKWIGEVPDLVARGRMTQMMEDHLSSAQWGTTKP